jgi:EmrB/QacA subfamily drug resistance transporter
VVLAICCCSAFITGIGVTLVNLALPAIRSDFNATTSDLQWVINAYALPVATLLVLAGRLADRVGRKKVLQAGLLVFGVGSVGCGLATTVDQLLIMRAIQAIGGAMLNPVAISIISTTFRDHRRRSWAVSVWGAVAGISLAAGPVIGGILVEAAGWRSLFWMNVPVVLLVAVLVWLYVPDSRAPRFRRFDPLGQLLLVIMLGFFVYGVTETREIGWASWQTFGFLISSAVTFGLFLLSSSGSQEPVIDPRLFAKLAFVGSNLAGVCCLAALSGFLFLNSLYLQETRELTAYAAGLLTLPMALAAVATSPLAGRLIARRGGPVALILGGLGTAVGAAVLAGNTAEGPLWQIFTGYVIFGFGFGLTNPAVTTIAISCLPAEEAGAAGGIISTSRQIGICLGVAIVGVIVPTGAENVGLAAGVDASAWLVLSLCGVATSALGAVMSFVAIRDHRVRVLGQDEPLSAPVSRA